MAETTSTGDTARNNTSVLPARAIDRLPDETRRNIAQHLNISDSANLATVSRAWLDAGRSRVWENLDVTTSEWNEAKVESLWEKIERGEYSKLENVPALRICSDFQIGSGSCFVAVNSIRQGLVATPRLGTYCRKLTLHPCGSSVDMWTDILPYIRNSMTALIIEAHLGIPMGRLAGFDIDGTLSAMITGAPFPKLEVLNIVLSPPNLKVVPDLVNTAPNLKYCAIFVRGEGELDQQIDILSHDSLLAMRTSVWTSKAEYFASFPQGIWKRVEDCYLSITVDSSEDEIDLPRTFATDSGIKRLALLSSVDGDSGGKFFEKFLNNARLPQLQLFRSNISLVSLEMKYSLRRQEYFQELQSLSLRYLRELQLAPSRDEYRGIHHQSLVPAHSADLSRTLRLVFETFPLLHTVTLLGGSHVNGFIARIYDDDLYPEHVFYHLWSVSRPDPTWQNKCRTDFDDPCLQYHRATGTWRDSASYRGYELEGEDLDRLYSLLGEQREWITPGRKLRLPEEAWKMLEGIFERENAPEERWLRSGKGRSKDKRLGRGSR